MQSRYVVIVSRDRPDLLSHLQQHFDETGPAQVFLDRRRRERRQRAWIRGVDRRGDDRRKDISGEIALLRRGFAIVHRQEGVLAAGPMGG
jgi:hypothetical protein